MNRNTIIILVGLAVLGAVLFGILRFDRHPLSPKSSDQVIREAQEVLDRRLINFYGKVVDQDGKPLPGVQVKGTVGYPVGFTREHMEDHETTTDAEGLFRFQGLHGAGIRVWPKKDGYNVAEKSFIYSLLYPENRRFTPDRNNPVLFTMYKSLGTEPMICNESKFYHVPVDGTPVNFDLETGKMVDAGGDLAITVTRDLIAGRRNGDWDWSVRYAAMDGGIIEKRAEQMFIAPASGYRPYVEYSFKAGDTSETSGWYYLESRKGKNHARIQVWLHKWFENNRASVTIRTWLNPSGSRNLEYDSYKRIEIPGK